MIRVSLFDQHDSHFATFDLPELPRTDDILEIGFPNQQLVKSFYVKHVIHKMIQLPAFETKYVYGNPVQCLADPPWRWEYRLHGILHESDIKEPACVCDHGVTKCPRHGDQPAKRENCPRCGKHVLGYCAQGEYCTGDDCDWVA